MQLVQQLLAAVLNATYGISPGDQANIASAGAAYCNTATSREALLRLATTLETFNKSGDAIALPDYSGPADSRAAQAAANKGFWDGPLP